MPADEDSRWRQRIGCCSMARHWTAMTPILPGPAGLGRGAGFEGPSPTAQDDEILGGLIGGERLRTFPVGLVVADRQDVALEPVDAPQGLSPARAGLDI